MVQIFFDMDGTLADFYSVSGWKTHLEKKHVSPYRCAKPLEDMHELYKTIQRFSALYNVNFGVISWGAKNANPEYSGRIAQTKQRWLARYLPIITPDRFFYLPYGIPKKCAIRTHSKREILIDDSSAVCEEWQTVKQRIAFQRTAEKSVNQILIDIENANIF